METEMRSNQKWKEKASNLNSEKDRQVKRESDGIRGRVKQRKWKTKRVKENDSDSAKVWERVRMTTRESECAKE